MTKATNITYKVLRDTWRSTEPTVEPFFTAYALNGAIVDPSMGLRTGLPVDHPIKGPVREPSPLNTRWQYVPTVNTSVGI